jgi:hypothetical protein
VKAVGVFDRAFNNQVIRLARQGGDYHLGPAAGSKPRMAMMCVTSLATASKECQTDPKSCKAGKVAWRS